MTEHSTGVLPGTEKWSVVTSNRDVLGEGPVYVAKENAIYWVDVSAGWLRRYALDGNLFDQWNMGEPIGFAFPHASGGLILGLASGLCLFDPIFPSTQPHMLWLNTETDYRLNDGAVDCDGRLWFGVMHRDGNQPGGRLMCFEDGKTHTADSGYFVPNGPAFSLDGSTMFHADSRRGEIYAFKAEKGTISHRRVHLKLALETGAPDGMTPDESGFLWVAHWGGGCLSRFDQGGTLDRRIDLPVPFITNCVFAGPNLDRMFITTAGSGSNGNKLAGALFEIDPGVRGLMQPVVSG